MTRPAGWHSAVALTHEADEQRPAAEAERRALLPHDVALLYKARTPIKEICQRCNLTRIEVCAILREQDLLRNRRRDREGNGYYPNPLHPNARRLRCPKCLSGNVKCSAAHGHEHSCYDCGHKARA